MNFTCCGFFFSRDLQVKWPRCWQCLYWIRSFLSVSWRDCRERILPFPNCLMHWVVYSVSWWLLRKNYWYYSSSFARWTLRCWYSSRWLHFANICNCGRSRGENSIGHDVCCLQRLQRRQIVCFLLDQLKLWSKSTACCCKHLTLLELFAPSCTMWLLCAFQSARDSLVPFDLLVPMISEILEVILLTLVLFRLLCLQNSASNSRYWMQLSFCCNFDYFSTPK